MFCQFASESHCLGKAHLKILAGDVNEIKLYVAELKSKTVTRGRVVLVYVLYAKRERRGGEKTKPKCYGGPVIIPDTVSSGISQLQREADV